MYKQPDFSSFFLNNFICKFSQQRQFKQFNKFVAQDDQYLLNNFNLFSPQHSHLILAYVESTGVKRTQRQWMAIQSIPISILVPLIRRYLKSFTTSFFHQSALSVTQLINFLSFYIQHSPFYKWMNMTVQKQRLVKNLQTQQSEKSDQSDSVDDQLETVLNEFQTLNHNLPQVQPFAPQIQFNTLLVLHHLKAISKQFIPDHYRTFVTAPAMLYQKGVFINNFYFPQYTLMDIQYDVLVHTCEFGLLKLFKKKLEKSGCLYINLDK
jgi:hypothetical protein